MDGVGPTMPVFAFYSYNFRPFDLFGTIIVLLLSLNFFRQSFKEATRVFKINNEQGNIEHECQPSDNDSPARCKDT
jgi:hypothetical protein